LGLVELRVRERQAILAEAPRNLPRARKWLIGMMERSELPARERVEAGDTLAALGDPRFDPERWYMPRDEMVGFVQIPGGTFKMGSDPKRDQYTQRNEQPQHSIEVTEFYIQRYPVTVAQFGSFVGQSGYRPKDPRCLNGVVNHPVVNVNWNDAMAYCEWLQGELRVKGPEGVRSRLEQGWRVRLPSEAEWEKTARGGDGRIHPWGNEFDANKANVGNIIGSTSPVGSFPGDVSPYQVMDMGGNVREWCMDWYDEQAYVARSGKLACNLHGLEKGKNRSLRGGSWAYLRRNARCAYRHGFDSNDLFNYVGFRVVLSLPFSIF
jgi:formylglycine-generating enzyme required for sulfatase activity